MGLFGWREAMAAKREHFLNKAFTEGEEGNNAWIRSEVERIDAALDATARNIALKRGEDEIQ